MFNIFDLATKQVEREGQLNKRNELLLILDRAIKIRKYIDKHGYLQQIERDRLGRFKKSEKISVCGK